MKKKIIIIWLILLFVISLMGADSPQKNSKKILSEMSSSLVKVVAQNHKKYIASGVVLEKGLIVTSSLILRHNPHKIEVIDFKGNKYPALVKGSDKSNSLLLLKVERGKFNPIKVTKSIETGDNVSLVGVFYNNFPAIFKGIVSSATTRELMINAPVAPGSSGGAIINDSGELVGIIRGTLSYSSEPDISFFEEGREIFISSKRRGGNHICFGIPVNKVLLVRDKIKKYGNLKKGWLGVSLKKEGFAEKVISVENDSPAEKADIKEEDKIISMNGKEFDKQNDLINLMRDKYAGETIVLSIKRAGKLIEKKIKLGEYPKGNFSKFYFKRGIGKRNNFSIPSIDKHFIFYDNYRSIGVEVINLNEKLAKALGAKEGYGLMVKRVGNNSPAQKSGIKEADIIFSVNNKPVKSIFLLRDYINKFGDKELHIKAYRKGKEKNFNVKANKSQFSIFYKEVEKMRNLERLYLKNKKEKIQRQQIEFNKRQRFQKLERKKLEKRMKELEELQLRLKEERLKKYKSKKREKLIL